MASRKEQKEQLRREREEREAQAKAADRRRRLIGYGAGGAVVVIAAIALVVLLAGSGGGGSGGKGGGGSVLPGGGTVPAQKITDLTAAAKAAGCELKAVKATSRMHTGNLSEKIKYSTNPPTSGKHFEVPADDGEYQKSPDPKELVHAMEHGRVIIWFKKSLPKTERANLKALFDEDPYQMIITPDTTGMTYAVAATAWSRDPVPNGTGRLLGCPNVTTEAYDAIRAFKDEHRSNGPEAVP
jgi:hypothetical protein